MEFGITRIWNARLTFAPVPSGTIAQSNQQKTAETLVRLIVATLIFGFAAVSSGVSAAEFSDAELVDLGHSYVQAVNQLDAEAIDALISTRHMAQNIANIVGDSTAQKQELAQSFQSAIPTINRRILAELERQNGKAVFLRVHEFDGMRGPLIRKSLGDGYNYVLLLPVRTARTERGARIGDMYYATSGELLSASIGIAAKLMTSPSETFLGKLFGANEVDRELASRFQEVGRLREQNKLREAFDLLDQLQGNTRNHRLIVMNTIQLASQLDDDLYREELRRLAKHHKDDPRAAFTLLDHYFYENDLDSAMSIIDLMEQSYGEDAVLNIMRANVESARNRNDTALGFANTAVRLEPGNEDAQWTLLTLLVESEMFVESVQVLQLLESEFGYIFARENFEAEALYTDFVKSEEFAKWIKAP